jgi:hypothetical protein
MADLSIRQEKLCDSRDWPLRHLTVSMEAMALLAILDAWVNSTCCALMLDFILMERKAIIDEKMGIPARVTRDRLHEV